MKKIRKIIAYKSYFTDFLKTQPEKIQNKIYKILESIEILEHIPKNYLKRIHNTNGLYETRIQLGSNIWRVFCFFEEDKLIILLNGFQKKTQKTPVSELKKAIQLKKEYEKSKKLDFDKR